MSDLSDNSALKWIRSELDLSLVSARNNLERYSEDGAGDELIEECIGHLHQVCGTLQLVQIYGAAMLAEEMELVARGLRDGQIRKREDASEALMLGLVKLPEYLEKLEAGASDVPLSLLPLLNEMRVAREAQLLSEVALFAPGLDDKLAASSDDLAANEKLPGMARGVRHRYHKALLDWYRDIDPQGGLKVIGRVFSQLESAAASRTVQRLFRIAQAAVVALQEGSVDSGMATKLLIGKIDREIKRIIDSGESEVAALPPVELLKNLLYYTATADSHNPLIIQVQQEFDLDRSLIQQQSASEESALQTAGSELLDSLRSAIGDDLTVIKDGLDLFIRSQSDDLDRLQVLEEPTRKLADTLGMVGQGELRSRLRRQADKMAELVEVGEPPADQDLMVMASDILFIEKSLDNLSIAHRYTKQKESGQLLPGLPEGEFERLVDTVMHEASIDLARNKEAIIAFIGTPENKALLEKVPGRFISIAGAFQVLTLKDAAELIERLASYVDQGLLQADNIPGQEDLNAFADAVTGVEYYMEAVTEGRGIQPEILEVTRDALQQLVPAEQAQDSAPAEIAPGAEAALDSLAEPAAFEPELAPETLDADEPAVDETLLAEPQAAVQEAATEESVADQSDTAPEADAEPEVETQVAADAAVVAEPEAAPVASADKPPLEDIDPEILDIFIEEAKEELATIQEYVPRWRAAPDDWDNLTIFRRSFHTLKGSGRLVGAKTIGEFAWAIEDMLNRVIDRTIEVTPDLFDLLEDTAAVLPALIDAQEHGTPLTVDIEPLLAEAYRLQHPDEVAEVPEAQDDHIIESPVESLSNEASGEEGVSETDAVEPEPEFAVADDIAEESLEGSTAESAAEESDSAISLDPMLLEIFESESKTHIETLKGFYSACSDSPLECRVKKELVRALHTLHGSADMSGVEPIAQVSTALESLVAELQNRGKSVDDRGLELLLRSTQLFEEVLGSINVPGAELPDWHPLYQDIKGYLIEDETVDEDSLPLSIDELSDAVELTDDGATAPSEDAQPSTLPGSASSALQGLALEAEDDDVAVLEEPESQLAAKPETPLELPAESELGLAEESDSEIESHGLDDALPDLQDETVELVDLSVDDMPLDALQPDASSAGEADALEDLGSGLDDDTLDSIDLSVDGEALDGLELTDDDDLLEVSDLALDEALDSPVGGDGQPLDAVGLTTDADAAGEGPAEEEKTTSAQLAPAPEQSMTGDPAGSPRAEMVPLDGDPDLVEIFLDEGRELLDNIETTLQQYQNDLGSPLAIAELQRTLHTLKGGARLIGAVPMGDLSHGFESLLTLVAQGEVVADDRLMDLALAITDRLIAQIDALSKAPELYAADDLLAQIEGLKAGEQAAAYSDSASSGESPADSPEGEAGAGAKKKSKKGKKKPDLKLVDGTARGEAPVEMVPLDGDPEMVEIFLEEGRELIDALETSMQSYKDNLASPLAIAELQRTLHTLKGGSRLIGALPMGDLSHAFESLLTSVAQGDVALTPELNALALSMADRLAEQLDDLTKGPQLRSAEDLLTHLKQLQEGGEAPETTQVPEPQAEPAPLEKATPEQPTATSEPPQKSATAGGKQAKQSDSAPARAHEQVRVRSDLLDRLVNHAGEVSIYRARLEQQNGQLGFNLNEMEQTVVRLRDQLRQLEIETEAQILSRYEKDQDKNKDFDPLEMDRFSTMQQVSRSLMETVNDLSNINTFLEELQSETDTLLLQQSRITTDLQDGLMRTRMVPFSQIVPRLHRLVRQTSRQVGKQTELILRGAQSEIDRGILERMIGPLEHVLRNAISHGIETPAEREAAGKSAVGHIILDLAREGADIVLKIDDDGAGISIESIRKKAIKSGLLDPNADVSDEDILPFVLEHGFSTAKEVTQISGRGVGLDVVTSEVKQLGGSVEIKSQEGKGASFLIRLPLTLAITDALLVDMGGEIFAIPHTSVEGVVRISRQELQSCYQGEQERYNYAGRDYQVKYLGHMLGVGELNISDARKWYPMLLVRAGERHVALHVDEVLGNRQIVVKSVGVQISTVRWISGGTILGDGRVALILDVAALVRLDVAQTAAPESKAVASAEIPASDPGVGRTVMVVDDSITVRKVTGRLLERNGMNVITAKDGVDAVATLQEHHPDIMLLDIEMPRMDGFELARHMRSSEELQDIPIIMITSRSGDKHRNIALELGVKRYLGKPYQEADLLENIYAVLTEVNA